jgi:hypothetical protein
MEKYKQVRRALSGFALLSVLLVFTPTVLPAIEQIEDSTDVICKEKPKSNCHSVTVLGAGEEPITVHVPGLKIWPQ